jgi:hypothetical protein
MLPSVHERGRLAFKRDQQKWNPVLRPIARQIRFSRSARAESGFGVVARLVVRRRECLLHRFGWRNEAPRHRVLQSAGTAPHGIDQCHIL